MNRTMSCITCVRHGRECFGHDLSTYGEQVVATTRLHSPIPQADRAPIVQTKQFFWDCSKSSDEFGHVALVNWCTDVDMNRKRHLPLALERRYFWKVQGQEGQSGDRHYKVPYLWLQGGHSPTIINADDQPPRWKIGKLELHCMRC